MYNTHDYIRDLQYTNKSLREEVDAFKSGHKYLKIVTKHKAEMSSANRTIKEREREIADAHNETVTSRNIWIGMMDDLDKDHIKDLEEKDKKIAKLEKELQKEKEKNQKLKEENITLRQEKYAVETKLEEQKEINRKLNARLEKDHDNSSNPSSKNTKPKKITNNREKTDNNQGGQPGHEGHKRKRQEPTVVIELPTPPEFENNEKYVSTGREIRRQMVDIQVTLKTVEYVAKEYKNTVTGDYVYADFPEGFDNDVNYGGSIKAFAFLLNNYCNASIDKTRDFMKDITGGALQISKGMINGLSKKFSINTKDERNKVFSKLVVAPVINVDFTTAKVNGERMSVTVCATPNLVGYYPKEHKGDKGIKGTPIELNKKTHVHDHDISFYKYGRLHQECLAHILRYLLSSMQIENSLTWHKLMRELIREMIHYRNSLGDEDDLDPEIVSEFEHRYDEILDIADREYEYDPPTKYNKDGFNLKTRLREYKKETLLFLHDKAVPHTNNLAERLCRIFKRKQLQMMTFRSFESFEYLCHSLSIIATLQSQDSNLYQSVSEIFA